jgi:acyl-coenzyme A thioesterase PaaI-like protein
VEDRDQQRARKHRLTTETRRLVAAVALLDIEATDAIALERMTQAARDLAHRLEQLPSLRAQGGLASANHDDDAGLVERSPFSGQSNPLAPPLHVTFEGERTSAWAIWPDAYEGPPGVLHGGFVAAAFDDLMGLAQMAAGRAGYTGTLTVKMRQSTPLNVRIDYEAGVKKVEGRRIVVWGTAKVGDQVVAEAEILFVERRQP